MTTPQQFRYEGYTLTSLMIGMTIGLFIISVAGKIYLHSRNTFLARSALSSVHENGRFALQEVHRILSIAGMRLSEAEANEYYPVSSFTSNVKIKKSSLKSDAIALYTRQGSGCNRYINVKSSEKPALLKLEVRDQQLMCKLNSGRYQALVSGVKAMKILYGYDDTNDGYANRYLTSNEIKKIEAENNKLSVWGKVVSLQLGLLVFSSEYTIPLVMRPQSDSSLKLPGAVYTILAGDKFFYTVFSSTVYLRNVHAALQAQ